MHAVFHRFGTCALLAFLLGHSGFVVADGAARVEFAVGEVVAVQADGGRRPLARGVEVNSGETIDTGGGRTQLRFTDGAMVSLHPQTRFRIDDYRFAGQADGSEKGFFSLLRGAMRTITGVIGKSNQRNYRLGTTVATIGIRGTEYSVAYGDSVVVTTGAGAVEVCNPAGCLLVRAGQSAYVKDGDTAPVFTTRPALPPLVPPPESQRGFSSGEDTNVITPPRIPQSPQNPQGGPYR